MSDKKILTDEQAALAAELAKPKVSWQGYVAFIFAVIFFSGILVTLFPKIKGITAFDFSTLIGSSDVNIVGKAKGAIYGFRYALNVWPTIFLAVACMNVVEGKGGLKAAQRMLNVILKPICGIPGYCGLSIITTLFSSTDAGAVMARELLENNLVDEKELSLLSCFNFVGGAVVASIIANAGPILLILAVMNIPLGYCFGFALIGKFIAVNLFRIYLKFFDKQKPGKEVIA